MDVSCCRVCGEPFYGVKVDKKTPEHQRGPRDNRQRCPGSSKRTKRYVESW